MDEQKNKIKMFEAISKTISLALPMAGSHFINVASGFFCMTMLATLGHQVLAATALTYSTQLSIMVTGMSILFSISVLVGHAHGAKDYSLIGAYVQQGWILAFLISLPIMLFFWKIDSVLIFLKQPVAIIAIVKSFFHTFTWAVLPGLLAICNLQFAYGINKKIFIFAVSVMSILILISTAYVMIFGKLGMPKMGVAGLAIAITAQYSFFFIITTLFFYFDKSFSPFKLFHCPKLKNIIRMNEIFKIGWPISVQTGGEMLSIFVGSIIVGWLGTEALAASQIVNQYYFLAVIPIVSLSQASGILVGHACGTQRYDEVKQLSYVSIVLALLISTMVALMFFIFPTKLTEAYIDITRPENAIVLRLTYIMFFIIAFAQIFDAIRNVLLGILRGLFDTQYPMIISLIVIWVIGLPLSYILAIPLKFGVLGFAIGNLIAMAIGAFVLACRLYIKEKSLI